MVEAKQGSRRVAITGMGVVSPLGHTISAFWENLLAGRSGVRAMPSPQHPGLPLAVGGAAEDFTGQIADFEPLEAGNAELKKQIKKAIKLMCRETQMGVAAAQHALAHAGLASGAGDPERRGVSFGAGFMLTQPEDFSSAIQSCVDPEKHFHFEQWGPSGIRGVNPLWLLKYLPNMPACHIAIYNDYRGPNNSLTQGETAANAAIGEAAAIIQRGWSEVMLCGATDTRLHALRTTHVALQDAIGLPERGQTPEQVSRPFELNRRGMVLGEGAGAMVLEEFEHAQARGAKIYGEVIGWSTACAGRQYGDKRRKIALASAIRAALRIGGVQPSQVGHVHAHGLGTPLSDAAEAEALVDVFGEHLAKIPVAAAKSNFGNLGAGSGAVEAIASVLALADGRLFPVLNYDVPDPACPVRVARGNDVAAGNCFLNLSVGASGQASCLLVKKVS